eukprot:COSAG06_NODE_3102_length_5858_cov_6.861087_5_plen_93_part_00
MADGWIDLTACASAVRLLLRLGFETKQRFIPNSHMAGRRPREGEDNFHGVEAKSILARKGDCVMFRSDVWHRGSKNSSDRYRSAFFGCLFFR